MDRLTSNSNDSMEPLRATESEIADVWDSLPERIVEIADQISVIHNMLRNLVKSGFTVPGATGAADKLKEAHGKLTLAYQTANVQRDAVRDAVKFMVDHGADGDYIKFAVAAGIVKYSSDDFVKVMRALGGDD